MKNNREAEKGQKNNQPPNSKFVAGGGDPRECASNRGVNNFSTVFEAWNLNPSWSLPIGWIFALLSFFIFAAPVVAATDDAIAATNRIEATSRQRRGRFGGPERG